MGLWVQNVGVRAHELPPSVAAHSSDESFGVPEPFDEAWTWTSLDDDVFLDSDGLDDLAERAAIEAAAPVLAFSVHDSDSVYLVGADVRGIAFRLGINVAAFDEGAPDAVEGARDAAVWAAEHAPASPSAEELIDAVARRYVFAEEGLAVVLAQMGLVPEDAVGGVAELEADELDDVEEGDGDDEDDAPLEQGPVDFTAWPPADDRALPEERWYATLSGAAGPEGHWWIVAFYDERPVEYTVFEGAGVDVEAMRLTLEASGLDRQSGFWAYVCGPDGAPRSLDYPSKTLEDLARELRDPHVRLRVGDWEAVPRDVPATLSETCAWVSSRPR
jgi:hypothetical protein